MPTPAQPANATTLRLGILTIILALEALTLAQFPHPWLAVQQPLAAPIVFAATLFFFARNKLTALHTGNTPISRPLIALHIAALITTIFCDLRLRTSPTLPLEILWATALITLTTSIILALFPLKDLVFWLKRMGVAWLYAAVTTIVVMSARTFVRLSWDTTDSAFGRVMQRATFAGVHTILQLFYNPVISDPATAILGTTRFQVQVAGACSGIEGIALMLAFTLAWLLFTRKELRLTRALCLIPIALSAVWLLNLARIATLIAIGDHGHLGIALNGFHSEAGWLLFNLVAIAFLIASQRINALRRLPTN